MTKKEYEAYYQRVSDNVVGRTYYDPMMNMAHVMTIDEKEESVIPILSKDCESMTWFEKQQCVTVQKCLNERRDIDYAEALLLLGDTYKENINSYMDYGRMFAPGLYPIRWYELELLAWSGSLDNDLVCICRDVESQSTYNYVHVCRDGYVKRTSMNGDRLFDPDNNYICFLIDLEYASFIRRKMKREELKDVTIWARNDEKLPFLDHLIGYSVKEEGTFNILVYLVPPTLHMSDLKKPNFKIFCMNKEIQDKLFDDLQHEFIFEPLTLDSIRSMLISKNSFTSNSWYITDTTTLL